MTKKIITLLTIGLTCFAANAVELKWEDWKASSSKGYDAVMSYIDSVDTIPSTWGLTIDQWKIDAQINTMLSAFHYGKNAEEVAKLCNDANALFTVNVDKLTAFQAMMIAKRIGNYQITAAKLEQCKASINLAQVIEVAVACYQNGAISKAKCVEYLLFASVKPISIAQMPAVTKAVANLPKRGVNNTPLMTAEEKKEFYGNILSLTDVTKESAELLGICKTEYQLVK